MESDQVMTHTRLTRTVLNSMQNPGQLSPKINTGNMALKVRDLKKHSANMNKIKDALFRFTADRQFKSVSCLQSAYIQTSIHGTYS